MRVEALELIRLRLPLARPYRAAHGIMADRVTLLVRLVTDSGEGWGECPALPAPTYSPEWVDGAELVLRQHLGPRLLGRDLDAEEVGAVLGGVVGNHMAKAALELALLDAELKLAGRSLAARLGATRPVVDCGVAVGIADTTSQLLDTVTALVAEGYRRVKLKISPGWDVKPVAAVRHELGDDYLLQVDANGSYRPGDLDPLRALEPYGLALIEQPYPADALLAHAELARRLATPVCLEESITSAQVAADAIAVGACDVISVKPGHVGGWLEAVRVHDLCRDAGIPLWCGGMLESGVGRAAVLALAALPGFTLPGDVSPTQRWFTADVTEPLRMDAGRMTVPTAPGIGVRVDPSALEALTVDRGWVPRP